jgi:3',5'-nucleoside bisphosphate phosphatase
MKGELFTLIKMKNQRQPIYIDFHTHTMYSDGIETPETLAENLKLNGIDLAAKTDHDTIAGYLRFKQAADQIGLGAIPGLEFSDKKYHILGLGFNPENIEFSALVDKSKYFQRLVTEQRVELMEKKGIPITMEKIDTYYPQSRLGKHNIFRTLYKDQECRNWLNEHLQDVSPDEVFDYMLRENGIAGSVPHYHELEREEIIQGIHNAGGIAVLAHGPKQVENIMELAELRDLGLDGYEIQPNFYGANFDIINYRDVEKFAKENHMLLTYGSDYHGASLPRKLLGRGQNTLSPELEERISDWITCKGVLTR